LRFTAAPLPGAWIVDVERLEDERGFFARTWSAEELEAQGLNAALVQCSISYNRLRGTLRGMHYQSDPHGETKLVRCTMGALWDVIVDLRRDAETFRRWFAVELSAENRRMLYIPPGFAHGFLTLTDATEVLYQMGSPYIPEAARGVRWNDPAFAIDWPFLPTVIAERDAGYADFGEATVP
jgi:dTDP-4-dehydrorhamnose 3,5-epimerase